MFRLFIMLTLASSKIILEKEAIVTDAIVTSVSIHTHAVVAAAWRAIHALVNVCEVIQYEKMI